MALAAMLRAVAALILAEGRPDANAGLLGELRERPEVLEDPKGLDELERAWLGCSVGEASAYLLALWGFSHRLVHLLAARPVPADSPGVELGELVLAVASARARQPQVPRGPPEARSPCTCSMPTGSSGGTTWTTRCSAGPRSRRRRGRRRERPEGRRRGPPR